MRVRNLGFLIGVSFAVFALMTLVRKLVASPEIAPIHKNLKTIPDHEGNYDVDGVSFDDHGVVVGSDNQSSNPVFH